MPGGNTESFLFPRCFDTMQSQLKAQMAELVDAPASGAGLRK